MHAAGNLGARRNNLAVRGQHRSLPVPPEQEAPGLRRILEDLEFVRGYPAVQVRAQHVGDTPFLCGVNDIHVGLLSGPSATFACSVMPARLAAAARFMNRV